MDHGPRGDRYWLPRLDVGILGRKVQGLWVQGREVGLGVLIWIPNLCRVASWHCCGFVGCCPCTFVDPCRGGGRGF